MRFLYLLTIAVANILTAKFRPFILFDGLLIIPVGSLLVGATFMLRDVVQVNYGKQKTYRTILVALLMSAIMSFALGDTVYVAIASAAAFFVSEAIDTEIFTRLRRSIASRVLWSGLVGGTVDSVIFVIFGLSPIGADALAWSQVPFAIIGQTAIKAVVQIVAVVIACAKLRKLDGENNCKSVTTEKGEMANEQG